MLLLTLSFTPSVYFIFLSQIAYPMTLSNSFNDKQLRSNLLNRTLECFLSNIYAVKRQDTQNTNSYFIWYCIVNTSVSFINVPERLSGFHPLFILFPMWNFCPQSVLLLKSFYTWMYVKCFVCFTPLINILFEIHLQTRPCEHTRSFLYTIQLLYIIFTSLQQICPHQPIPFLLNFVSYFLLLFFLKSFKTSFCCSNIRILWSSTWK